MLIYIYIYLLFNQTSNPFDLDEQVGFIGGATVSFNGWAMKKRGPVLVSVFGPISTVISVVFTAVTLGDTIDIGRYVIVKLQACIFFIINVLMTH